MSNVIYQGPSLFDGGPIAHVLTGLESPSRNPKTGPMLQTWVIRADQAPHVAVKEGHDASVCGSCPLRGEAGKGRTCYVTPFQAPNQVFRSLPAVKPFEPKMVSHRAVRLAAYGEVVFTPIDQVAAIAKYASHHTGYTHQWKSCDQEFKKYLMASVGSEEEYHLAKEAGWRAFRIMQKGQDKLGSELLCPASKEAGNKLQCITCGKCNGLAGKGRDVAIYQH